MKQIRVIVFAAHPDEADCYAGGTIALFADMGHAVKAVALTNGDAGHFRDKPEVLAKRRLAEAKEAGKRLGAEYDVLDYHDGGLTPSIEVREHVIRKTREWKADVVIAFHPEGCAHADNRIAGEVVRDASAFIALTPNVVPDTPPLKKSPFFFLMPDYSKRDSYTPDIVIATDESVDKQYHAIDAHESQAYEYGPWRGGCLDKVPKDKQDRMKFLREETSWVVGVKDQPEIHGALKKWYGAKAKDIKYAEPYEIAYYSLRPSEDEIRELFPMLPAK